MLLFQAAFDDIALFFYDVFGGNYIGVVWKPSAVEHENQIKVKVLKQLAMFQHSATGHITLINTTNVKVKVHTLDGRLSRPRCKVASAEIRTCNLPIANPALYHTATNAPSVLNTITAAELVLTNHDVDPSKKLFRF